LNQTNLAIQKSFEIFLARFFNFGTLEKNFSRRVLSVFKPSQKKNSDGGFNQEFRTLAYN